MRRFPPFCVVTKRRSSWHQRRMHRRETSAHQRRPTTPHKPQTAQHAYRYMSYGERIPDASLCMLVLLVFSFVQPLVPCVALLYFILATIFWRYDMLYSYRDDFQTGGMFWPVVRPPSLPRFPLVFESCMLPDGLIMHVTRTRVRIMHVLSRMSGWPWSPRTCMHRTLGVACVSAVHRCRFNTSVKAWCSSRGVLSIALQFVVISLIFVA